MPASTVNIDEFGLSGALVPAHGLCSNKAGQMTKIYTDGTDYTNLTGERMLFIKDEYDDIYYAYRPISNGSGSENPYFNGTAWVAASGTCYYQNIATNQAISAGPNTFYYSLSHKTLGTVKNITVAQVSTMDVVGMPGMTDEQSLLFDVEGVVTRISVEGKMFDTTAVGLSNSLNLIADLQTGTQYTGNGYMFWGGSRWGDVMPKCYCVGIENFSFTATPENKGSCDYKLSMIRRKIGA